MSVRRKIIQTKIVYKNPYFSVRKDTVLFPSGKKNEWFSVDKDPFITVIALDNKNKTYLVGQWRYSVKKYSWELPAGGVDKNEKPLEAAKRELKEETGLEARQWKYLGSFYIGLGIFNQLCYVFLALDLIKGKSRSSEIEKLKIKKVTFKEVNRLIKKNKIFDEPTITALYLLKI